MVFRLGVVLVGLAGLVAVGMWTAAAWAEDLTVNRIRVEGNERLAEDEIVEALGLQPGSSILSLDLTSLKRQLMSSPWVKDVQLTRVFPATLTLRLVERDPIGVAVTERLYLIDEKGSFLDEMGPRYSGLTLPLVRGIADEDGRVLVDRQELAGRVLVALAEEERLESAISEVDISEGAGSILIRLRRPPLTILASEGDLVGRLTEILPLTEAILHRFPSLEVVDVRFRDRVYLRLPAESSEPENETGGIGGSGRR